MAAPLNSSENCQWCDTTGFVFPPARLGRLEDDRLQEHCLCQDFTQLVSMLWLRLCLLLSEGDSLLTFHDAASSAQENRSLLSGVTPCATCLLANNISPGLFSSHADTEQTSHDSARVQHISGPLSFLDSQSINSGPFPTKLQKNSEQYQESPFDFKSICNNILHHDPARPTRATSSAAMRSCARPSDSSVQTSPASKTQAAILSNKLIHCLRIQTTDHVRRVRSKD